METREILSTALELAKNSKSVPLRISAIAVIGEIGGNPELGILKKLAKSSNPRLQIPARSSLQRLSKRLETKKA